MAKSKWILGFLFFALVANTSAQIPDDYGYQTYKAQFPKDSYVILELAFLDEFDLNKEGLQLSSSSYEKFLCLNEYAINGKKRAVGYDEFYPIIDVEAKMHYPQNGKYKTEKVKDFADKAVIDGGSSFYDNSRERSFSFENIREGAVGEIEVTRNGTDEYLVASRRFSRNYFTKKHTYLVKCHKNIDIGFYQLNLDDDIKATEWEEGDYKYYQWQMLEANKKSYFGDYDYASYFLPVVVPYVKSYSFEGEQVTVLEDTDGLYKWYTTLIAKIQTPEGAELSEVAQQIGAAHTTEEEKVKAVYQWVQENIKYIAFSDGYGGFVPRDPDEIVQRRFGDCKDMSCLIIYLLDEIDIEAHFTWVGTRHLPYRYTDVPSPVVDNHMIATYLDNDGNPYYLDATNSNLKFGNAPYSIQGKQVLIGIDDSTYQIIDVPIMPSTMSANFENITLSLSENKLIGTGEMLATGYHAQYVHDVYSSIETDKNKKNFLSSMLEKSSNKFELLDYTYNWSDKLKDSLKINYSFEVGSFANHVDKDIYFNLNLSKEFNNLEIPDNRNVATFYEFLFEAHKTFTLELPENVDIGYMPPLAEFENELLKYHVSYTRVGSQLIYQLDFVQKVIKVEIESKEEWNEAINNFSSVLDKSIKLTKIGSDE